MNRNILAQYLDMKEEIRDIRERIKKLEKEIDKLEGVADTVKGTRLDGTYGVIKVEGYPTPLYYRKKNLLDRYKKQLEEKEVELLALTIEVEEFVTRIEKSDLRLMARLYFIDGYSWVTVAHKLNNKFPHRNKPYTEDGCRMRMNRFLEN